MKKSASILVLLLFLSFVLVSLPQIGVIKAEMITYIYIRADGSVEGTDKIQRDENFYTLTDNIYNSTIFVEKDGVVIDGAGCTLRGQPSGIVLCERDNVTIKNFVISIDDFAGRSINLYFCSNCTIMNNTMTSFPESDPLSTGMEVWGGVSNVIAGNRVVNNICGIYLGEGTSNNSIFGNNITGNLRGMRVYASQNNSIHHNNFIDNEHNIYVGGARPGVSVINAFDDGATGNHWNDYNGTDSNGDGIGDTPYIIDENNQDNYPLVNVIPEFPSWIILPLLLTATLVIIICKQRLPKTPNN